MRIELTYMNLLTSNDLSILQRRMTHYIKL